MLVLALLLALAAAAQAGGADVFEANCAVCHQPDGNGIPGMYPPLANSVGADVRVAQGRSYLVHVVSFGLAGAIAVHGTAYNGVMQPWPQLSDRELAEVLDYILTNFNGAALPKNFTPLSAAEVKKYRSQPVTMSETYKERAALMKTIESASASAGSGS
jgi:mono/diheme cytochrome c family protein